MNEEDLPPNFARRSVLATLGIAGLYLTEVIVAAPVLWRFLDAVRPDKGVEFLLSLAMTTAVALIFGGLIGLIAGDSKGVKAVIVAALAALPFVLTAIGLRGLSEPGGSLIPVIMTVAANLPGVLVGVFYGARMKRIA